MRGPLVRCRADDDTAPKGSLASGHIEGNWRLLCHDFLVLHLPMHIQLQAPIHAFCECSAVEMDVLADSSDYSDSEIGEYEQQALEDLKWGRHVLQNSDGTLKCPFCIGKKKHDYKYGDLLQHAQGVGQGKRGEEPGGKHRALAKFMKEYLPHMNEPPKPRIIHLEQETPRRPDSVEHLVWPWMAIVVNIARRKVDGMYVAAGNSELKERFAGFGPTQVRTLWNHEGHQGMAVLEFRKDMSGYEDALSFERSFSEKGLGRKEWSEYQHGKDLYGWIARREDFESRDPIGRYLREKGNLKTVAQISEENLKRRDQLVENLSNILVEKDKKIENWQGQVKLLKDKVELTEIARKKAEYEKHQLEEQHRREIEKVEQEIQQLIHERSQEKLQVRKDLEQKMMEIEKQRKELEKLEIHTDAEKLKLEDEKKKNEDRKEQLQKVNNIQQKQEQDQLKLIEKHKKENEELISELHRHKKKLASQQKLELEIQRLKARIETQKHLEGDIGEEQNKHVQDLESKLHDLQEDMEGLQEMNQHLMNKERVVNDELQEARKVAIKVLDHIGNCEVIDVKRMGELTRDPWEKACKKKYKDTEDWALKYTTLFSLWEDHLRDSSWYPFKMVQVQGRDYELKINETDEKLSKLRQELGDEVCQTVVKALEELNEYNASGRYPVAEAWNYKQNRKALVKEIIEYMYDCITKTKDPKSKKQRRQS